MEITKEVVLSVLRPVHLLIWPMMKTLSVIKVKKKTSIFRVVLGVEVALIYIFESYDALPVHGYKYT